MTWIHYYECVILHRWRTSAAVYVPTRLYYEKISKRDKNDTRLIESRRATRMDEVTIWLREANTNHLGTQIHLCNMRWQLLLQ